MFTLQGTVHFHNMLLATKLKRYRQLYLGFTAQKTKPHLSRPKSAVDKQVNLSLLF